MSFQSKLYCLAEVWVMIALFLSTLVSLLWFGYAVYRYVTPPAAYALLTTGDCSYLLESSESSRHQIDSWSNGYLFGVNTGMLAVSGKQKNLHGLYTMGDGTPLADKLFSVCASKPNESIRSALLSIYLSAPLED